LCQLRLALYRLMGVRARRLLHRDDVPAVPEGRAEGRGGAGIEIIPAKGCQARFLVAASVGLPPTLSQGLAMTRKRCITEMGMGVDVHGKDATKAAKRAGSDAIRHSSLSFVRLFGKTAHDMFVDVTIGVPNPEALDTAAVAKELPYGKVTVTAVKGGLEVPAEQGTDSIL